MEILDTTKIMLDIFNKQKTEILIKKELINNENFIPNKIIDIDNCLNNVYLGVTMRESLIELKNKILSDEISFKNEEMQKLDNLLIEISIKIKELSND